MLAKQRLFQSFLSVSSVSLNDEVNGIDTEEQNYLPEVKLKLDQISKVTRCKEMTHRESIHVSDCQ